VVTNKLVGVFAPLSGCYGEIRASVIPAALWGVLSLPASAEETKSGALAEAERFDLGTIEVMGTSSGGWDDPVQPTVTADDIRRFERNDVVEAVSLLPGVEIQNSGSRSERLIYVRGFNSRQVPLFVDGIPVYVPYDGNIDLSRFTTFDLAEVSVTKGFTSMLFGANTLGGSVNIVTRKPQAPLEVKAGLGMHLDDDGDRMGQNGYFNVGTDQGLWYAQLSGSLAEKDFFTLPSGFDAVETEDGGHRKNSATRDGKMALRFGYTPNETDEYALSYYKQMGEKETPPYAGDSDDVSARFWQWPVYDKESLYFSAQKALTSSINMRGRLFYDQFYNRLQSFDDEIYTTQNRGYAFNSIYDDHSWGGSLELETSQFEHHDLKLALHMKVDDHRETDGGDEPWVKFEDQMYSIGVEDRIQLQSDLTLIAGVSKDWLEGKQADNLVDGQISQFDLTSDSANNGQLALLYDVSDELTARISAAKRTRFPTIKDRYSFRMGSAIPNPDLEPETGNNFEVGVNGHHMLSTNTQFSWGGAYFYSDIADSIESVRIEDAACTSSPCSQLQNIGKTRIHGIELQTTFNIAERWEYHLNYTWIDKDNLTEPDVKPLDTPKSSATTYLTFWPDQGWSLTALGHYNSDRNSDSDGSRVAPGFIVADLKAAVQIAPQWQAELAVNNLTDKLYAYDEGYYEAGRSYIANVRWNY